MKKNGYINYLFKLFLMMMSFFSFMRLVTLCLHLKKIDSIPVEEKSILFKSFIIGTQFDWLISSYVLILPFFYLLFCQFLKKELLGYKFANFLFLLLFVPMVAAQFADIPFFLYFFDRLNSTIFIWFNTPIMVLKILFSEPTYLFTIGFGFSLLYFLYRLLNRISKSNQIYQRENKLKTLLVGFICLVIIAIGTRGRLKSKSPLREGSAFFSAYPFANKLALNPAFTLVNSLKKDLKNKPLELMPKDQAKEIFTKYYGNLQREVKASPSEHKKMNVVLVLMESMTARRLTQYGNSLEQTPVLNQLNKDGISFNHAYSLGIHTFNGIFSTLFSWPAVFRKHPMKVSPIPQRQSIASELRKHGYTTNYFTTHDGQFDNAQGYLKANGFENVFDDSSYPEDKIVSSLGVGDHFLFEYAIKRFNEFDKNQKPFFAAIMTGSNHNPWVIPEGISYKPAFNNLEKDIVHYADWSIGHFLKLAKNESWYKNTLFVFVADHGLTVEPKFEMPISYHHTPLIFFHDGIIPKQYNKLASQMDVFPSIMGFLNLSWNNTTYGIDLFKENRSMVLINSDDKFGVLTHEQLYIRYESGIEKLFQLDKSIKTAPFSKEEFRMYSTGLMQMSGF